MLAFLIRRTLSSLVTLFFILTLIFFVLRLAPGGPFDGDRVWPAEIQKNIELKYGLDLPIPRQYFAWASSVLKGDLKESFQYLGRPVTEIIRDAIGVSAVIGAWALMIALSLGIPLGAASAWSRGTRFDRAAVFLSMVGVSLPNYLLAGVLILVFSLRLGWLPPALWDEPASAVLPALTLAIRPASMILRLTRASVLETLRQDFIRTARAKGASEPRVLFVHGLRASLIPVVTLLGPIVAALVTGSFVVELIFQIPGLGKHFVGAIVNRDYPLAMGLTLTYGTILLTSNLLVDLAYGWLDPRVRQWD